MMKRFLRVAAVVLVVVVVLLAALPWLASTGWVREKVLRAANERAPGVLDVGSWRLHWFGGQTARDVVYEQEDGTSARVEAVRVERGLLALARDPYDIGRVEIIRPTVRIAVTAAAAPEEEVPPPVGEAPPPVEEAPPPAWPALRGALVITDGRVEVVRAGAEPVTAAEDLNVTVELGGDAGPIRLEAALRAGETGGAVAVKGTLDPGTRLVLTAMRPDLVVEVRGLDLGAVSALLPAEGVPSASGILEATVTVAGTLADGMRVRAAVAIPGLALAGELFKGDAPRLGDLALDLDAEVAQDRLSISNLSFRTGIVTVRADGLVGTDADGTLTADVTVDMAEALTQFRRTVGLQEGMELQEGVVTLSAGVTRAGEDVRFEGKADMAQLRGVRDGRELSWDAPTRLDVAGTLRGRAVTLERLQVQSPLLTANGSGSMEDLELTAGMDLASALREARKFVALEGWDVGGEVALEVRATAGEADGRRVVGSLVATEAHLARDGVEWIPPGILRLQWSGEVQPPDASRGAVVRDAAVDWQAWLGGGTIAVERVELPAVAETGALPVVTGAAEQMSFDLAKVGALLRGLGLLDADMELGGSARVSSKLAVADGVLEATDVGVDLDEFLFRQGEKELRDAAIRIRASGRMDPVQARIQVPAAVLTMSAGTLRVQDLDVRGGGDVGDAPSLQAAVDARLALDSLLTTLGGFSPVPDSTRVAGNAAIRMAIAAPAGEPAQLEASADLEDLRIDAAEGASFREDRIHLATRAHIDAAAGTAALESFGLTSTPVSVSATAAVTRQGERVDLTADGSLALDLARVGEAANALLGTAFELQGKDDHPFHLDSYRTGQEGENVLTQTAFSGGLSADVIRAFGLDIRDLTVPVALSNGVAAVTLRGQVNEGRIDVQPVIDFNQDQPSLVLVQPTNLLAGVQLTEALADGLLAHIHPIFKGATGLTGTMDLSMDEFTWPLDAAARSQARFNGLITFRDLQLQTSGLLNRVLQAAKVREREMQVATREIRFACRDGRIEASPMQLRIKDHELVLAGTVGLDQTLDYTAQIPVTEDLVGKDAYPYLADTTLRLPIRGSVSEPDLGVQVLQQAAADLTRQALRNAAQKAIEDKAGKLLEGLFRQQ